MSVDEFANSKKFPTTEKAGSSEREQVLRTCYHSSLKLAWNLRDPAKASDRRMYASSRIQEYPKDTVR